MFSGLKFALTQPPQPLVADPIFLTPHIDVDPETYVVKADGQILTCDPMAVLPMAQRYFLF